MLIEALRVIAGVSRVEAARVTLGPAPAATAARRFGLARASRSLDERARLRRAISWIDRLMPGGPNCYRRVLLEMALDSGAAHEPLMMGFRSSGGLGSGHAWLASRPPAETYDAVVSA